MKVDLLKLIRATDDPKIRADWYNIIRELLKIKTGCANYQRPEHVLGGPCVNCGRSQTEHSQA
jgi:hypothetical protein